MLWRSIQHAVSEKESCILYFERIVVGNCYALLQSQFKFISCNIVQNSKIDNITETYKAVTIFFNTSPKREGLLEHIFCLRCISAQKRKVLIGLCKTRWSERDIAYEHFYLAIPFIVESFEVINGAHPKRNDFNNIYTDGWDPKIKQDATSYLHAVTKFEFIIGLVSLYRLLHPLDGITQTLQGSSIDVVKAYNHVQSSIDDMKLLRENMDDEFKVIYQQSERMATKLGVEPAIPRTVARQMHRNNVPAKNPEKYYRRVIAVPLIDRFRLEITFRFNSFNKTASKLLLLVPSIICHPDYNHLEITDLTNQFSDDLPNPDIIDQELRRWKRKWMDVKPDDRPNSLVKSIKVCDKLRFPNIFILLKIGCTLPVTSEELFSNEEVENVVEIQHKLWTTQCFSNNAHKQKCGSWLRRSVEIIFTLHPRKMNESNLIFD